MAIFEVAGGTDKGPDGHRIDTPSIVKALEARGAHVEVLFYSDSTRAALFEHCVSSGVQAYGESLAPAAGLLAWCGSPSTAAVGGGGGSPTSVGRAGPAALEQLVA